MFQIVGADLGNDSLKITLGLKTNFRLKNAISQRMKGEVRKDLGIENLKIDDINQVDENVKTRILNDLDVVITSDHINGRFFVGELAANNGDQEVEVGTHKADNPNIVIPLITMLALNIPETQKEGRFKIVCGLPITEFTTDRERFKNKLIGNYSVLFKTAALRDREVMVTIEDVVIIPEGVAVIMNQMLDDTGTKFRNPELRKGQHGVIDIGAFTTDIPVIVDGKPDNDASVGIQEGIANYLDTIVRYINNEYSIKMTRSKFVEKIEQKNLIFPVKGNLVNVEPYVKEQFQIFANKIVSKVDNIWSNHSEIRNFYVVGGGAKALEAPLKAEMEKRKIKLSFIEDEDPQMQNALGYYKYARQKFGARNG